MNIVIVIFIKVNVDEIICIIFCVKVWFKLFILFVIWFIKLFWECILKNCKESVWIFLKIFCCIFWIVFNVMLIMINVCNYVKSIVIL